MEKLNILFCFLILLFSKKSKKMNNSTDNTKELLSDYSEESESEEYYESDEDLFLYEEINNSNNNQPKSQDTKVYEDFFTKFSKKGSSVGNKRLMDELTKLYQENGSQKFGYQIEVVEDNLYHWQVKLFDFPKDSKLYSDLQQYHKDHILLDITFPDQYPFQPPFVRVIYPRFRFLTGHITIGGSICMEVLTTSGWSPSYSIENLLMQIKSEIVDPQGEARIDLYRKDHYTVQEAKEAFDRLVKKYGWN